MRIAATLVLAGAIAATIHANAGAAAPALPPLTVNVSSAPNVSTEVVRQILAEADAIWRAEGFRFVWQYTALALFSTLHVTIGNTAGPAHGSTLPLGWIVFTDGRPRSEIVVSYPNAQALMHDSRDVVGSLATMPVAQRDRLLGRVLGRALAHELAHYLLETKAHTLGGLLQAKRTAQEFFGPDRSRFRLDREQRNQIASRLRRAGIIADCGLRIADCAATTHSPLP